MEFEWRIKKDKIRQILITKDNYLIEVPVDETEIKSMNDIEYHFKTLDDLNVKFEALTVKLSETGGAASSNQPQIGEYCKKLSEKQKKFFTFLKDDKWTPKSEVDKEFGYVSNPQGMSGILAQAALKARKTGLLSENEGLNDKIIEGINKKGVGFEYRLRELGSKIKEFIQKENYRF